MNKKVLLLILDGWGITQNPEVSAVAKGKTPFMDSLPHKYPNAELLTHGMNVGLPEGQMGNSEVGHMNLGAGRIVYQDLAKINLAVQNNTLKDERVIQETFQYAKDNGKKVHLLGLLSDGGVHSHINHLKGLLDVANDYNLQDVFVHAFTDGRDVDPKSGIGFVAELQKHMDQSTGKLASVIGRYFAMDRDKRWERVKKAYDLVVHGKGTETGNPSESIKNSYENGVTDEFIEPLVVTENDVPIATIAEDDVVLFFNFRTDRGRELTQVLSQEDFPDFEMSKMPLYYVTMTNYDDTFQGIKVVYDKENIKDTLGETLANAGKTQIRIAETEKYPHVTFFFNGGREEPYKGEKRILCPSPKVATYDLKPEMSAFDIRDKILPEIKEQTADFICLNFANPDMVGHTGVMEAAMKACEVVDECTKEIVNEALAQGYATIIIADHGNSETMKNPDGSPNTAHTTNPVPLILVDKDIKFINKGVLGDIAPTILTLMGVEQPEAMTQESLI
ncbi:2,3-bisphosphoglycerate-independent phosphoglycerate mutase [Aureisphaera galaxeae]|uniref:2,3-bisphosphoglycerate-independent phosphoglycerate mutase n=1 Tax=Aureisphaera galaxeae TaxID=1538023 RepID=UPI002350A26D|nr:2,3-bisphosphoglycerate-independent phosphoglycerate mutase [Aureisphaera galaxeae]MDC8006056.1 2,3-bisphosphoglycerate-independent phosphoglycerate mutase [Aureisphaera galaxeae]